MPEENQLSLAGDVRVFSRRFHKTGVIRQFGTGTPGQGGVVPLIGADGPLRQGEQAGLHLRRGVGKTPTLLTVGLAESAVLNFPKTGMTSYNSPWHDFRILIAQGTQGVPGDGQWSVPFTVTPIFSGLSIFVQAYVVDAAASGGLSSTQGLEITFD